MQTKVIKSLFLAALSVFVILFSTKSSTAQKFMIGYGLSIYSDFYISTPQSTDASTDAEYRTRYDFSILSLSVEMKYNLHEFNTDLALSVASSPSFGLSSFSSVNDDAAGFGNLRIPLYLQLDYGNLSTFQSMKNFGVGIGIGYQFDNYGLFGDGENVSFGTVATRVGLRYFNRNNKSREVAIKFGLPKNYKSTYTHKEYNNLTGDYDSSERSLETKITSIQLSWILYFNY